MKNVVYVILSLVLLTAFTGGYVERYDNGQNIGERNKNNRKAALFWMNRDKDKDRNLVRTEL
jgi:hypothetical protein